MRAHEIGLELNCHVDPCMPTVLMGDPRRLRQVITNLLSNAIKFTDQGEVVIHVEPDPGAVLPGSILFRVSDTGIGIPAEKLDTIFDQFTQADPSSTRRHGGAGLGLTISRRLIELMGGRIWVESSTGEGSTFYFTAQLGVPEWLETRQAPSPADIRGLKTLIVDDNATNRLILVEMLNRWGIQATQAQDGYQALAELDRARLATQPYQLVLLDHRMPGLDGFQVVERIKSDLGILDVTIMMLTSDNRSGDIARCRELGVSRYTVKPIKRSELLKAISGAIGDSQASHEEPSPPATSYPNGDLPELRILLVEDSEDNRTLVQAFLKKTPYRIDVAEDGERGIEMFTSGGYDLVLMDIQMPVMDGCTATRAIRKWEADWGVEPTPIIALTASALREDVEMTIDAGCTAHVSKPVKKARLLEAISEHTTRSVHA